MTDFTTEDTKDTKKVKPKSFVTFMTFVVKSVLQHPAKPKAYSQRRSNVNTSVSTTLTRIEVASGK